MFDDNKSETGKKTHSANSSKITVPLRGGDTFVAHAATVWNALDERCAAQTKPAAKKAALNLARRSPL